MEEDFSFNILNTYLNKADCDITYTRIDKNIKVYRFYKGTLKILYPENFDMFPSINIVIMKKNNQNNFDDFVKVLKNLCKDYKFIT